MRRLRIDLVRANARATAAEALAAALRARLDSGGGPKGLPSRAHVTPAPGAAEQGDLDLLSSVETVSIGLSPMPTPRLEEREAAPQLPPPQPAGAATLAAGRSAAASPEPFAIGGGGSVAGTPSSSSAALTGSFLVRRAAAPGGSSSGAGGSSATVPENLDGFDCAVGPGGSLADGVRRCPPGGRMLVRPGSYSEQLVLDSSKEIHVFGQRQARVLAVVSRGACGSVDGLLMEGAAVYGGALELVDCVVAAGLPRGAARAVHRVQGVSLEGGHPTLRRCVVTGCGPVGVRVADLDGAPLGCEAVMEDCEISGHERNVEATAGPVLISGSRLHDADAGVVVRRKQGPVHPSSAKPAHPPAGAAAAAAATAPHHSVAAAHMEVSVRVENSELHSHRRAAVDVGLRTLVAVVGCTLHHNAGFGICLAGEAGAAWGAAGWARRPGTDFALTACGGGLFLCFPWCVKRVNTNSLRATKWTDPGKSEVLNCHVSESDTAVSLWRTPGAVGLVRVANNTITYSETGLLVAMGGEPEVVGNSITQNRRGVVVAKGGREERFGQNDIRGNFEARGGLFSNVVLALGEGCFMAPIRDSFHNERPSRLTPLLPFQRGTRCGGTSLPSPWCASCPCRSSARWCVFHARFFWSLHLPPQHLF